MEGQGDREGDNDPEVATWVRGDIVNQDGEHRLLVGRMTRGDR